MDRVYNMHSFQLKQDVQVGITQKENKQQLLTEAEVLFTVYCPVTLCSVYLPLSFLCAATGHGHIFLEKEAVYLNRTKCFLVCPSERIRLCNDEQGGSG